MGSTAGLEGGAGGGHGLADCSVDVGEAHVELFGRRFQLARVQEVVASPRCPRPAPTTRTRTRELGGGCRYALAYTIAY